MRRLPAGVSLVVAMSIAAAAAGACGGGRAIGAAKLQVVTAFYPLEEVARRLGGNLVHVVNLTPPGGEPHDLELRPSDVRRIRTADLVLYLDDGFQPGVEGAVRALPDRSRALDLLAGMPLRPGAGGADDESGDDPHVWLSPALMERIVARVARALSPRLPSGAARIRARAASLSADLEALDDEYRAGLARCARREIFTSHAAFAYLADRYDLRQIAITGLSPETEPSPRRLQDVARRAREAKATTIFFETLVSPRVARAVARIVGARTAVLDPVEGLTPAERSSGADYFSIMRVNLRTLQGALRCGI